MRTGEEAGNTQRRETGQRGEKIAAAYLRSLGYTIVESNFRCPLGEVDLIARLGELLVFVEVRSRTSTRFGTPEESVNREKQWRVRRLAAYYLQARHLGEVAVRCDVVAVIWLQGEEPQIRHYPAAF